VITLPAEIDISNATDVKDRLTGALVPGAEAVIADLTATYFCDSSGLRVLANACKQAAANGIELRLAVPSAAVLRVIALIGLDGYLAIYPSLGQALES
jgi:anti-anti-sigma factor